MDHIMTSKRYTVTLIASMILLTFVLTTLINM